MANHLTPPPGGNLTIDLLAYLKALSSKFAAIEMADPRIKGHKIKATTTMEIPTRQQIMAAVEALRQAGKDAEAEWMHAAWEKALVERFMGEIATLPTRSAKIVPIRPEDEDPSVEPDPAGPFMVQAGWPDGQRIDGLLVSAVYGKDRDFYLIEVGGVRLTIIRACR